MHEEPKRRHRQHKQPGDVFFFSQTAVNDHLCELSVQILALNKEESNFTIYFLLVIWLAIGCFTESQFSSLSQCKLQSARLELR